MANPKKISTPLTEETARSLKMGDEVLITGTIYTGQAGKGHRKRRPHHQLPDGRLFPGHDP